MQMPDFTQWASEILSTLKSIKISNPKTTEILAAELEDIFNKGYHLGRRDGYIEGSDNGWWKEQEKLSKTKMKAALQVVEKLRKAFPREFYDSAQDIDK